MFWAVAPLINVKTSHAAIAQRLAQAGVVKKLTFNVNIATHLIVLMNKTFQLIERFLVFRMIKTAQL